jgi:hypothetical protein
MHEIKQLAVHRNRLETRRTVAGNGKNQRVAGEEEAGGAKEKEVERFAP